MFLVPFPYPLNIGLGVSDEVEIKSNAIYEILRECPVTETVLVNVERHTSVRFEVMNRRVVEM